MTRRSLARGLDPELFRALADPQRVAIVAWLLAEGAPKSVGDIARSAGADVGLSMVSRHLGVLFAAGVVERSRRGRTVLYRARGAQLSAVLRRSAELVERAAAPRRKLSATRPQRSRSARAPRSGPPRPARR